MEARPCRASIPQRGSIEPAPSPAFRPSRRWRPCLGAPRLLFGLPAVGTPASLSSLCASSPGPRCRRRRPHRVARRLVSRPARARALARLARLAARGPAPTYLLTDQELHARLPISVAAYRERRAGVEARRRRPPSAGAGPPDGQPTAGEFGRCRTKARTIASASWSSTSPTMRPRAS